MRLKLHLAMLLTMCFGLSTFAQETFKTCYVKDGFCHTVTYSAESKSCRGKHIVYDAPIGKKPKSLARLGTNPQFGTLKNYTTTQEVYDHLHQAYKENDKGNSNQDITVSLSKDMFSGEMIVNVRDYNSSKLLSRKPLDSNSDLPFYSSITGKEYSFANYDQMRLDEAKQITGRDDIMLNPKGKYRTIVDSKGKRVDVLGDEYVNKGIAVYNSKNKKRTHTALY